MVSLIDQLPPPPLATPSAVSFWNLIWWPHLFAFAKSETITTRCGIALVRYGLFLQRLHENSCALVIFRAVHGLRELFQRRCTGFFGSWQIRLSSSSTVRGGQRRIKTSQIWKKKKQGFWLVKYLWWPEIKKDYFPVGKSMFWQKSGKKMFVQCQNISKLFFNLSWSVLHQVILYWDLESSKILPKTSAHQLDCICFANCFRHGTDTCTVLSH